MQERFYMFFILLLALNQINRLSMTRKNYWTYEEHILAFNLYCKIPFSKINAQYPPVKELAIILKRSNNAVAMKLANFARLDPALKARNISGLTQGAKGEIVIWNEFNNNWEELSYKSECILAKYNERRVDYELEDIPADIIGKERDAIVKLRVNQNFFRKMILASYNTTCCITGSNTREFLTACHIVPWNVNKTNRMNPQNGLCMNILFHSAYDQGFFTITPEYRIRISRDLIGKNDQFINNTLVCIDTKKITLPQRFIPNKLFLEYHNDVIFRK